MNAEGVPDPSAKDRIRRLGVRLRSKAAATTLAAVAALALIAASIAIVAGGSGEGCSENKQTLTVVAAAEVVPAVSAAAKDLNRRTGSCLRVTATDRPSADTAAALVATKTEHPDVWIPDSSIWLQRVTAAGVTVLGDNPSIALSPVVLAVSRRVAEQLGWPGRRLDMAQLLGSGTSRPVRLGLPDPERSSASIGAVRALRNAVTGHPDGQGALANAVRAAVTDLPADSSALLDKLAGDTSLAVAVSEQSVSTHNSRAGVTNAVAAFPAAGMTLDYPFVVLASAEPNRAAAARLLGALQAGAGYDRLRADGFRNTQGGAGPAVTTALGADSAAPTTLNVPSVKEVEETARIIRVASLSSRMLAVVDVSGSMGEQVPDTNGKTRLELTREASALGLALFPDDTEIGLWVFSTNLTPSTDYHELVPIGPLGARSDGQTGRALLVRALSEVRDIPGGSTGLYDTTLAAVRTVRNGWSATRVNSVVLLTDGRNDDDNSITLAQLISTLQQESTADRPVPVITIAYGPDSDADALGAISKATGGALYLAKDARQINDVFIDAIGRRLCRPQC